MAATRSAAATAANGMRIRSRGCHTPTEPAACPRLTKVPRMRRTALALVLAAALAGCGSSEPTIPVGSLNKLVLRQQDLGATVPAVRRTESRGTSTTRRRATTRRGTAARGAGSPASTARAPPRRRGRSSSSPAPTCSRAPAAPKKDLTAYRGLFASPALSQRRVVTVPKIGDDAARADVRAAGGRSRCASTASRGATATRPPR